MIVLSGALVYRPQGRVACAVAGGDGCAVAGRFTRVTLWLSAAIFAVGAFFAYGLVPVLRFLDA